MKYENQCDQGIEVIVSMFHIKSWT